MRPAAPSLTPGAGPAALGPASHQQPAHAVPGDCALRPASTPLASPADLTWPHYHWSLRIDGFLLAEAREGGGQSCACGWE